MALNKFGSVIDEVKRLIFGSNSVIVKELKICTYCCYFRCMSDWEAKKQAKLITMHSQDFQTEVVQSMGWLSAIVGI